jgi:drug/metabolite transporter (DMT)-like permease
MLRPSASGFATVAAIGALVAALAYACNAILLRVLTRTDTTASVALWSLAVMTVVAVALALPAWVTVGRTDIWFIIALGVVGAVAQMCMIEAFRAAPASVIAPFEYSALFWGICIDWVVWQALPTLRVLAGGGIVIGCGLYIIWRERQLTMRR